MEHPGRKLRVLTVTSNALSGATGIGSTFLNFFDGCEGVELASVYTGYGLPQAGVCRGSFRITEKSLVKNLKNRRIPSGERVDERSGYALDERESRSFDAARKARPQVLFLARELIWRAGRVVSPELKSFVREFAPDLIFAQINDTEYLSRLTLALADLTGRPVCLFIGDDFCSLKRLEISPLFWFLRLRKRRVHKKLIKRAAKVYMMTDIAKREYDAAFGIDCGTAAKSLDFSGRAPEPRAGRGPLRLTYTGNLYNGRWKQLAALGGAIQEANASASRRAELCVWSATPLTGRMKKAFDANGVRFCGCAPSSEMPRIMADSDVLVHAEADSPREAAVVRLSFSTKLVDYMHAGRCILAVGPRGQASMAHLDENGAAVCVYGREGLLPAVKRIMDDGERARLASAAWECGRRYHNASTVRPRFAAELQDAAFGGPFPG